MQSSHTPYSYRDNPSIPPFDDSAPIAFMDGGCALCAFGARLIARFDKSGAIRICPTQSALGSAVLRHYGLDPQDPESWLYLEKGRAYISLNAVIRAARRAGDVGWLLQPLRLIPRGAQDWLYRRLARNRYALFGRADLCALPDPKLRARLME